MFVGVKNIALVFFIFRNRVHGEFVISEDCTQGINSILFFFFFLKLDHWFSLSVPQPLITGASFTLSSPLNFC